MFLFFFANMLQNDSQVVEYQHEQWIQCSIKVSRLQVCIIRKMLSRMDGVEPAAGEPLCWGAKHLRSGVFKAAGCNVDRGRFLGLEAAYHCCDIVFEWTGGGGRRCRGNKESWHPNRRLARLAPCCYASIYQPGLFAIQIAHTIQMRGWGVAGRRGDLFNRGRTLWAGGESISASSCAKAASGSLSDGVWDLRWRLRRQVCTSHLSAGAPLFCFGFHLLLPAVHRKYKQQAAQPQPRSVRLCLLFVGLCSSTGWSRSTKKDIFLFIYLIDLSMLLR